MLKGSISFLCSKILESINTSEVEQRELVIHVIGKNWNPLRVMLGRMAWDLFLFPDDEFSEHLEAQRQSGSCFQSIWSCDLQASLATRDIHSFVSERKWQKQKMLLSESHLKDYLGHSRGLKKRSEKEIHSYALGPKHGADDKFIETKCKIRGKRGQPCTFLATCDCFCFIRG